MTDEERREITRNSYYAQLEMLGYKPDGTPKDMVEVIRCKDCKHYHKGFGCDLLQKPILKGDDWFCADGRREAEEK